MEKRPLSLTIVGWFLVITSVFAIYSTLTAGSNEVLMNMLAKTGQSLREHQVMGIIGCVVSLVCAYGILKGWPWSRLLYVGWGIVGTGLSVRTSPPSVLLIGLIFLGVIAFFLFRPAANRWFDAGPLELKRRGA